MQPTAAVKSSWFNSDERATALVNECDRWRGTPFSANGEAVGVGVSCQKLVIAIYVAVGVLPNGIEQPEPPMNHWRFSTHSLVEDYMTSRPEFIRLSRPDFNAIQTGDLLGFRLGHIVHHLGIALNPLDFFHVIDRFGAGQSSIHDATYSRRFTAIWRPTE
jgi:cell wall-associated NlpC family hydrolase